MERLQAFYDCRKNIEFMAMPDEIFKMLCEYWFKAEVAAARQRLFSL